MSENIGVALSELDVVTLRRIRTATLFLRHIRTLEQFAEFGEVRRLKADMDAADDAWHASYQAVENAMMGQPHA